MERPFSAPVHEADTDWETWRSGFRSWLLDRLGIDLERRTATRLDVYDEVDLPDHRRIRASFISRGEFVPLWILVPHGRAGRGPAVVAVHGHGTGVNEIVGLRPDGSRREGPPGYQHDFALNLVRRGYVVAAPELLGFGRRRQPADRRRGDEASSCSALSTWALMLGTTLIGQRVIDLAGTVDVLAGRDDVRPASIGIVGISGGATASLMAACLDTRLAAAVLSGYVSSFRASILAMDHCICNIVPGIAAGAEMADIALGISPRPLLMESGRRDPIFPILAATAAADRIRRGYGAVGAADRFEFDAFDGEHEFGGGQAWAFLDRWLAPAAA